MSKQINNFGPPASVSTAGELDLNITVTNNNSINRSMLKGKYRSDTNIQDSEEL